MLSALRRMLTIRLPDSPPDSLIETNNPIYQFLRRRMVRPFTGSKIRLAMSTMFLLFALIPVLFALSYYHQLNQSISLNAPVPRLAASLVRFEMDRAISLSLGVTAVLSFGLMVIGDLFTLAVTAGSTHLPRDKGHWELVTLTGIAPIRVIEAEQAIGQIRAWWFTILEMAVRITLTSLLFILAFTTGFVYFEASGSTRQFTLSSVVLPIIFAAVLGLWMSYEPYWRMRAMVATGVRISIQVRNPILLVLITIGSMLWMRTRQVFVLLALFLIFTQAALALSRYNETSIAFITVFVAVLLFVSRSFYVAVTIRETQDASDRVFDHDRIDP